jgi:hypothetical protein
METRPHSSYRMSTGTLHFRNSKSQFNTPKNMERFTFKVILLLILLAFAWEYTHQRVMFRYKVDVSTTQQEIELKEKELIKSIQWNNIKKQTRKIIGYDVI